MRHVRNGHVRERMDHCIGPGYATRKVMEDAPCKLKTIPKFGRSRKLKLSLDAANAKDTPTELMQRISICINDNVEGMRFP